MTESLSSPAPARILVVDDEPDLCTLYELTLLREGHQVQTAGTLALARQRLGEQAFDLVITDMRLPDGDGLGLLRYLAAGQRRERCAVQMFSQRARPSSTSWPSTALLATASTWPPSRAEMVSASPR